MIFGSPQQFTRFRSNSHEFRCKSHVPFLGVFFSKIRQKVATSRFLEHPPFHMIQNGILSHPMILQMVGWSHYRLYILLLSITTHHNHRSTWHLANFNCMIGKPLAKCRPSVEAARFRERRGISWRAGQTRNRRHV